jgi:hypothetical protein
LKWGLQKAVARHVKRFFFGVAFRAQKNRLARGLQGGGFVGAGISRE